MGDREAGGMEEKEEEVKGYPPLLVEWGGCGCGS